MSEASCKSIWYINHYAGGPGISRGYRAFHLAKSWLTMGCSVKVIRSAYDHLLNERRSLDFTSKCVEGIDYEIISGKFYSGNGLGRLINMRDFGTGLKRLALKSSAKAPDAIIYSSPHLSGVKEAWKLAQLFGSTFIFEVRDIWPMSLVDVVGMSRWNPLVLRMGHLERFAYERADLVVSLMPGGLDHARQFGVDASRHIVIPNGFDDNNSGQNIQAVGAVAQAIARYNESGGVSVIYAGAHGPPNNLKVLVDAAALLALMDSPPIHIFLVGAGSAKEALQVRASQRNLKNISFFNQVSKAEALSAIDAADIGFISLTDSPIFRYGVSPNKLFDYCAAGKPIVYAINSPFDFVRDAGCGISVNSDSPEHIAEAIKKLASLSPEERRRIGGKGREFISENHGFSMLSRNYLSAIGAAKG